jgi:hypothetical protein
VEAEEDENEEKEACKAREISTSVPLHVSEISTSVPLHVSSTDAKRKYYWSDMMAAFGINTRWSNETEEIVPGAASN